MNGRSFPLTLRIAGELVVIVVGVLIALWVDNLNEDRQDRARERGYLEGILLDLRTDSAELETRRTTAMRGLEVADRLLALRREPDSDAPADSLARWFFRTAFVDNFQAHDHTYREVLGAGGLRLIEDDGLRRAISDYYRGIESAEFFTEWYKGEETAYWDLMAQRLDPDDFAAMTRSEEGGGRLVPRRLLAQLRSDPEIANAVHMNRHWTELRFEITGRRLSSNARLAEMLRETLGGP